MNRIKTAIVGAGKIARSHHLPTLASHPAFELIAAASPNSELPGLPTFPSLQELVRSVPSVQAVTVCTPPQARYEIARYALAHGRHVMLEKPPAAALSEVASLQEIAERHRVTLFASWHSAAASGVEPARDWLGARTIRIGHLHWKEDVRVTHPGQQWLWRSGGFGVFDTGINAFSILTRIMPVALVLEDAELVYPTNCDTPIAATVLLNAQGASIRAEIDFRHTGPQIADIDIETDEGRLLLSRGGSMMFINGNSVVTGSDREYPRLYDEFARLIGEGRSSAEDAPLRLVADAFLRGRRISTAPFVA